MFDQQKSTAAAHGDRDRMVLAEGIPTDHLFIEVDRSKQFDPEAFFGKGWRVSRQPYDATLIKGFDLRDLIITTCMADDETMTTTDDRLGRMAMRGLTPLDMAAFVSLWEKREHFPLEWSLDFRDWRKFFFILGTSMLDPKGVEVLLYFTYRVDRWIWETRPANRELYYNNMVPCLEIF